MQKPSYQREDLVNALAVLSNSHHQDRSQDSEPAWPDLTAAVHWLIDDTWLDHRSATELIPAVLRNSEEAAAVDSTVTALISVLAAIGPVADDTKYLAHRSWPDVVRTATTALATLTGE